MSGSIHSVEQQTKFESISLPRLRGMYTTQRTTATAGKPDGSMPFIQVIPMKTMTDPWAMQASVSDNSVRWV